MFEDDVQRSTERIDGVEMLLPALESIAEAFSKTIEVVERNMAATAKA